MNEKTTKYIEEVDATLKNTPVTICFVGIILITIIAIIVEIITFTVGLIIIACLFIGVMVGIKLIITRIKSLSNIKS